MGTPLPSPKGGGAPQFSARVHCGQTAGWIKMPLGRHCVSWGPSSPFPKWEQSPPIFGRVYCGQTAGWIKMPLDVEVGLGTGHIVLDADPAPSPQRCTAPNFRPISVVVKWLDGSRIKMPLGREVGPSPSDIVLDGDPAPPPPKGAEPQFSSHVYCGQTARWIKMALGTEVGLVVLDGEPAPPL